MDVLRSALIVFNAPLGEIRTNIERVCAFAEEAKRKGAELVCFPEMCITGYSASESILPHAIRIGDNRLKLLRTACEDLDITLLPGMAEAGPEGRIFATHLAYIPGKKTGMYRKLHLSPPEQTIFSPGSDLPLFETCGFTFGIQLCYDAHFPFLSTRMAETGADALFIPHASPRGSSEEKMMSWLRHIPARAYDNGVYVLVCNQTGDNGNGLQFPGLSFFTDPSGLVVSQDTSGEEGLLICDLTRSALSHVRNHRMRYFLPHTRKDF